MKKNVLQKLQQVKSLAQGSRLQRFLHQPFRYVDALFFRSIIYPKNKKERIVEKQIFSGASMKIALPAATDIYLTGGKSHDSEIRLATFLITQLQPGDQYMDIGAHYGYFTLIAAELVGTQGKILSFEPTASSFQLLQQNTTNLSHVTCIPKAISDTDADLVFYTFPNLYSEYNTTDITQFEKENWFQNSSPIKSILPATTIDLVTQHYDFTPSIIKIDVEGAEYHAIRGGLEYFQNHNPIIVMEYLPAHRSNQNHRLAVELLRSIGYLTYSISTEGSLSKLDDIDAYLAAQQLDSDNIVFSKK